LRHAHKLLGSAKKMQGLTVPTCVLSGKPRHRFDAGRRAVLRRRGLTASLAAADLREAEHRLAEHRRDPASAIPWDQVRSQLYKRGG
jgi:hypothetical protein